jgi:hypothetical protein
MDKQRLPDAYYQKFTSREILLANVISTLVLGALTTLLVFNLPSALAAAMAGIMQRYQVLRSGGVQYECSLGGPTIQVAECQILQGANTLLFYAVTSLMEFTSNILRSRNLFDTCGRLLGLACMVKHFCLRILPVPQTCQLVADLATYAYKTLLLIIALARSAPANRETQSTQC